MIKRERLIEIIHDAILTKEADEYADLILDEIEKSNAPDKAGAREKLIVSLQMIASWAVLKEIGEGSDIRRIALEAADYLAGPIASEIARLAGERDAAVANAREPIGDTWDEIRRLEGECRIFIRERDEWKAVANRDLARAEAAETETARLRAEIDALNKRNSD